MHGRAGLPEPAHCYPPAQGRAALVELEVYLRLIGYELPLVNTEALHQTAQPTTTGQPANTLCTGRSRAGAGPQSPAVHDSR